MASEDQLNQIFNILDHDAKGHITEDDLRFASEGSNESIDDILNLLEMQKNEKINYKEFKRRICRINTSDKTSTFKEEVFEDFGSDILRYSLSPKRRNKTVKDEENNNAINLMKLILSRLDELTDQQHLQLSSDDDDISGAPKSNRRWRPKSLDHERDIHSSSCK